MSRTATARPHRTRHESVAPLKRADVQHLLGRIGRRLMIDRRTGCWNWVGKSVTKEGYPQLFVTFPDGRRRAVKVARIIAAVHLGDLPAGCVVRHSCDRPLCLRSRGSRRHTPWYPGATSFPGSAGRSNSGGSRPPESSAVGRRRERDPTPRTAPASGATADVSSTDHCAKEVKLSGE